ncbi:MAG TPA: sigma-70 family RNA polymerase sigma factor [Vicinamibacteria bacterium]|nr:sigma-70 family RNA polymerase sigma factor [Vicinamibacteria bacterium]
MFPTTRWTLILSSHEGGEAERAALEQLCATYWKPVYVFLRRKGLAPEAAEDGAQGFFLQLLQRDFLARLDPARGRFRSYLLRSLEHYLVNVHERDTALKRGGGYRFVPLDVVLAERELPAAPEAPHEAFEREWALGVMERAVARLQREYDEGRRKGRADVVLRFFGLDGAPSYAEAARACGMSVPQFKAALHRARVRFREILREEVAATVDDDADRDAEIGSLVRALR